MNSINNKDKTNLNHSEIKNCNESECPDYTLQAGYPSTCTCHSTGKTVKKICPKPGSTCDCTDPNNPKIICD